MLIPRKFEGDTAIVCGTGPSITLEIIDQVNGSGCRVFGANRAWEIFNCDVVHGCNYQFWDHYWPQIKDQQFDKWTTRPELEGKYPGLNYIEERWEDGLSKEQHWISAHHGTGPQLVNIAYLYGCTRLLLVGWDMRYLGKTGPQTYTRRRYLDEDPLTLNHWPRTGPNGEQTGLIKEMETIHPEDYGIEIINCTPDSAMTCFPMGDLGDEMVSTGRKR
jgi:hypothetical protein